jgi:hypothetical protein
MKKLLVVSLLSLVVVAACGAKPAPVTPANKTDAARTKTDGSMGGTSYGSASAAKPPAGQPGDPCAM